MKPCEYCNARGAKLVPVNGGKRLWLCVKCFGEATTPADREQALRDLRPVRPAPAQKPAPVGSLLKGFAS